MPKKGTRKGKFVPGDYKLRVRRSYAGLGLSAEEEIPKGKCVIEYFGRTLSKKEEYTSRSLYLFEINKNKTIDGSQRDNIARYINHSCKPNCEIEIRNARVFIMSLRRIRAGEELSYDYGEEYFKEHFEKKGCKCGAAKHLHQ